MSRSSWALPGIVFSSAFALSAACGSGDNAAAGGDCPVYGDATTSTGSGSTTTTMGSGGGTGTGTTTSSGNAGLPSEAEVQARLHGCRKLRFDTLGHVLEERGVDIQSFGGSLQACEVSGNKPCSSKDEFCYCPPGKDGCVDVGNNDGDDGVCVQKPQSAGFLYQTARDAFSVPKVDSRQGEKDGHTTASALRLMDVFIQAAPQIIANIEDPKLSPACTIKGQTWPMFASDNSCVEESVSCIIGYPATEDHMLLCNLVVGKADPSDPADVFNKQIIAVAALMSAAHSCE